jgi:hypothetical protein
MMTRDTLNTMLSRKVSLLAGWEMGRGQDMFNNLSQAMTEGENNASRDIVV